MTFRGDVIPKRTSITIEVNMTSLNLRSAGIYTAQDIDTGQATVGIAIEKPPLTSPAKANGDNRGRVYSLEG